jgi:hypothetical protein
VYRGAYWDNGAVAVRCAYRRYNGQNGTSLGGGFRCVMGL